MAENFMTFHSILRQEINIRKNGIKNDINSNNQTTLNEGNQLSNILVKNDFENSKNFYGNGEVFYNFDKKTFIKNINGMTKFFIALGTLDSRFDDEQILGKKTILHYVHIPSTLPKNKNVLLNNDENMLPVKNEIINENNDVNYNKKNDFTSIKQLYVGDTFLLHSDWIESQQSETLINTENYKNIDTKLFDDKIILEKNENVNEKLFISGKVNNNKNENFLKISQEEIIRVNDQKSGIKTKNSTNYLRIHDETLLENENVKESENVNENKNIKKNVNAVCVKFMGNIGGLWPTPQVRTCYPFRTYSSLLLSFFLFWIILLVLLRD